MSVRQRLANRRQSEFFQFQAMDLRFTGSISRYPNGDIAEIFIDNHKAGSMVGTLVRDSAIILSFALQYGTDLDEIGKAVARDGPVGQAIDLITNSSGA
jgi:hypothetical protein